MSIKNFGDKAAPLFGSREAVTFDKAASQMEAGQNKDPSCHVKQPTRGGGYQRGEHMPGRGSGGGHQVGGGSSPLRNSGKSGHRIGSR